MSLYQKLFLVPMLLWSSAYGVTHYNTLTLDSGLHKLDDKVICKKLILKNHPIIKYKNQDDFGPAVMIHLTADEVFADNNVQVDLLSSLNIYTVHEFHAENISFVSKRGRKEFINFTKLPIGAIGSLGRNGDNGSKGADGRNASGGVLGLAEKESTPGEAGTRGHDGFRGNDGHNGKNGVVGVHAADLILWAERFSPNATLLVELNGGEGQKGGTGGPGGRGGNGGTGGNGGKGGDALVVHTSKNGGAGGNGGNGGDGGRGGEGGDGGNGGTGGRIRIFTKGERLIPRDHELYYYGGTAGAPGDGGTGGDGGNGGKGGQGGPRGKGKWGHGSASEGDTGPKGRDGDKGANGNSGNWGSTGQDGNCEINPEQLGGVAPDLFDSYNPNPDPSIKKSMRSRHHIIWEDGMVPTFKEGDPDFYPVTSPFTGLRK